MVLHHRVLRTTVTKMANVAVNAQEQTPSLQFVAVNDKFLLSPA